MCENQKEMLLLLLVSGKGFQTKRGGLGNKCIKMLYSSDPSGSTKKNTTGNITKVILCSFYSIVTALSSRNNKIFFPHVKYTSMSGLYYIGGEGVAPLLLGSEEHYGLNFKTFLRNLEENSAGNGVGPMWQLTLKSI